MNDRKMIAVSPEVWAKLKKLQIEESHGGTVPPMGRLIERGLRAIETQPDLLKALRLMVEHFSHYVHEPIPPIQPGCRGDNEWIAIQQARAALERAGGDSA